MTRLLTTYEWDIETFDEHGDINDHRFAEKISDLAPNLADALKGNGTRLVLVRNVGNDEQGLVDRLWAYVKDGVLPEFFENELSHETSTPVPKRFRSALAAAL